MDEVCNFYHLVEYSIQSLVEEVYKNLQFVEEVVCCFSKGGIKQIICNEHCAAFSAITIFSKLKFKCT